MTKLSEIKGLTITKTEDYLISSLGHCQFCRAKIQWVRCRRWIGGDDGEVLAHEFPFKDLSSSALHICRKRPTGWAEQDKVPEGWEYDRSDDDDAAGCFIAQKYTEFV